jgi:hypothetical protein
MVWLLFEWDRLQCWEESCDCDCDDTDENQIKWKRATIFLPLGTD